MVYLLITIILTICEILYIKIAKRYNIVDNPNFRSSHTIPTIRGGGILFYVAVLLFFVFSTFQYPYFMLGISGIAIVSFIDDIKTLSAKIRLPFQFIAIALVLYQLGLFNQSFLLISLLTITGVAFINLYNFMDGINGITGLYSFTILIGFLGLNYIEHIINPDLIGYVMLSIVVFGYYNFRTKALLFAGDIGSISLAMVIFFLGLYFLLELEAPVLLLMGVVYGVDSCLTLFYRMYLKENIAQAHRHHMYQKLVDVYKWSHMKVAITYTFIQLLLMIVVLTSYQLSFNVQLLHTAFVIVLVSGVYVYLFKKAKKITRLI